MNVAVRRSLWYASKAPARFIAGRRRTTPQRAAVRSFHTSSSRSISFPWITPSKPSDQDGQMKPMVWNSEQNRWEQLDSLPAFPWTSPPPNFQNADAKATGGEPSSSTGGSGSGSADKDKTSHYGSALRRSQRNRKAKELPPVQIPFEFLSWNVRRHRFDGALTKGILHLTGKDGDGVSESADKGSAPTKLSTPEHATTPNASNVLTIKGGVQPAGDSGLHAPEVLLDQSDRDAVLVRFYASLQECSHAYNQMEETYGPPGEELENWENLPDKWSAMPNLATKYEQIATEFEEIATQAFAAFPNGELAQQVSSEPELGEAFAKHVNDLELALNEVNQQANPEDLLSKPKPSAKAEPQSAEYLPQYSLNHALFAEVLASISAGLSPTRPGSSDAFARQKSHVKLLCPIDGGIYFLDKVVEEAATRLGADVTVLDPQDLAEMASDYIREGDDASRNALSSLGFDASQVYNGLAASERADEEADGEDGVEEEVEREQGFSHPKVGAVTTIPLSAAPKEIQNVIKRIFSNQGDIAHATQDPSGPGNNVAFQVQPPANPNAPNNEAKLTHLLDTIIEANIHKRDFLRAERRKILGSFQSKFAEQGVRTEGHSHANGSATVPYYGREAPSVVPLQGVQQFSATPFGSNPSSSKSSSPKSIVLLRDFKEMRSTPQGARVVDKIVDIVSKKRQEGKQIMLVGTSSSSELVDSVSQTALENLQMDDAPAPFRTVAITPDTHRGLYYQEERRRIRDINGRHLFGMVKRLDSSKPSGIQQKQGSRYFASLLQRELEGTSHIAFLEESVLSFDDAHRIVFAAMGQRNLDADESGAEPKIEPRHIATALELLKKSDAVKNSWAQDEFQAQNPAADPDSKENSSEARLKKLRKTCNSREKALLRGVVNPENIQTTFNDVHATPETIEALKTLTTLSLTRPEAFKYGVLAKDKLSGLLLYGPPGTGKTLLAKAVAKQSGATMLEVSGSDVYDMYVGEGEKNVRAVFSLAKKLAPCVVFIDEADAIFASRGSNTNRNSHRELINQFLREWDGMNETSAFIMVATNRPFDLDDAALRRLPRRLLVDLPSEKDREAILGIHLKDEALDGAVSLAKLASQTPLYSGSDLKNVAVAAALAAVREENDVAAKHTGAEPHKYPERRTLEMRHFDKAMEEISASINEDMSSLGAIRKFDEKYGDRRGRKKRATYGFSSDGVAKEETAKVRS